MKKNLIPAAMQKVGKKVRSKMQISRETFKELDPEERSLVMFDYLQAIIECQAKQKRSLKTQLTVAGVTGFVGGMIAHILQAMGIAFPVK